MFADEDGWGAVDEVVQICLDPITRFFDGLERAFLCFVEGDAGCARVSGIDESIGVEAGDCSQDVSEFGLDLVKCWFVEFFDFGLVDPYCCVHSGGSLASLFDLY